MTQRMAREEKWRALVRSTFHVTSCVSRSRQATPSCGFAEAFPDTRACSVRQEATCARKMP